MTELAVLGWDHWAETALSGRAWAIEVVMPAATRDDDVLLWREGLRRLHPGRCITLAGEMDHAAP
jgi:hypothetical protein